MNTTERVRLNLVVSPQVKERIERLQEAHDGATITEVVRRALALLEDLTEVRREGSRLLIESSSGEIEKLRIL